MLLRLVALRRFSDYAQYNYRVNMNKLKDSPRVLSIQSHVIHGYVGNKSATFPLQVLGFEVDAINTVQFSNHTGYEHVKGQVVNGTEVMELMEGLSLNNIDHYTHLLTGYSRSPESLLEVANIVKKLKAKNPDLLYVCDPVMGDNGKMYVPQEVLPVYRDTVIGLADILTPNQYETELLTGIKINNLKDARKAIQKLHDAGAKIVVLSSSELGDENNMISIASIVNGNCYSIRFPKFAANFTGTGDLFAALMLAWTYKSDLDIKSSLEKTISTMQCILKDTLDFAKEKYGDTKLTSDKVELRLIQNKNTIENPIIEATATIVE
ncbi:pyridoxal kinase [Arctopsyche grandis]|uniref:pyridoxal kinase n=1 Tax=Arctopsyche grandis TaxID=121162 RepID=UPI00406D9D0E